MARIEATPTEASLTEAHRVEEEESQIQWSALWKPLSLIVGSFLVLFCLPMESARFRGAVLESLALA